MAFLTLKNLRFRQGTWEFAIDAKIERNSCTAIIGPSGAGKSTLLKLLAGVEPVTSGAVRIGSNVNSAYYAQHQLEIFLNQIKLL